ncbi:hypothetical protein CR513_26131, partial [Mucuna pruriens]
MAPDRTQLQNMAKKENETFKGMIENVSSNFSNLVIIEERIEMRVRNGRISQGVMTRFLVILNASNKLKLTIVNPRLNSLKDIVCSIMT